MKYVNFQLYMANPDVVMWKKLTTDDKYLIFYTSNKGRKIVKVLMRFTLL